MLTLSLEKRGAESPKKLQLSLSKGARFTVKIAWQCEADHQDDVDIHALEASNSGGGAKVTALESILSTYNTRKMNPRGGVLQNNPDGSFSTPSGGLTHSGDIRVQGNFETIIVDGSRIPEGVNEIPLFATVHRAEHGGEHEGSEDGDFNVVQLGSVMLGSNGWEYAPVGRGFTGTINDVLAHFS
ncbi:stress protein [Mesorhizobium loti]|uniref:Stress protein n=1 Tax=Rhizobium loti TaxID=381 RepID=A0A101KSU8_RHILI|nr:stress protein [Mesorhizobium loti]